MELPNFVNESFDNCNEFFSHLDSYIKSSIDKKDTRITFIGIQNTFTNSEGKKFNVIVTDTDITPTRFKNRLNYMNQNGGKMDEGLDKLIKEEV